MKRKADSSMKKERIIVDDTPPNLEFLKSLPQVSFSVVLGESDMRAWLKSTGLDKPATQKFAFFRKTKMGNSSGQKHIQRWFFGITR